MAREQKAKIEYVSDKGEKCRVTDKVVAIAFKFNGVSEPIVVDLSKLPKDIMRAAAVRGVAEKIRDTYAGSDTVVKAYEVASDMLGRMMEGNWLSERDGGGPRMTMLLSAIKEVREGAGLTFDLDASHAKYVNGDDDTDEQKKMKAELRRNAAANTEVARVLERMKAEAAARRAEKADPATVIDVGAL